MVGSCVVVGEYVDNRSITSGGGRNFRWIGIVLGICHSICAIQWT